MESAADHDLLARYVAGSRAALDELVRRHLPMVYAAALREVQDRHQAEDIAQAVFMVLMRRAGSISPKVNLAGWLFNATRYTAANARKLAARRWRHEREAAAMLPVETASIGSDTTDLTPLLNEAIAALPAKDRDAVVMFYLEGRPHAEVAAAQRLTETAARQRLFRAMQKLRQHFARRGVVVAEAALIAGLTAATAPASPPGLAERVAGGQASAAVTALTELVLRRMAMAYVKLTAVVLLVLAMIAVPWAIAQSTRPATAPVAVQASDGPVIRLGPPRAAQAEMSPQAVLVAAWRSGLAGEVDKHVGYFHNLTPEQDAKQRKVAELLQSVQGLADAVTRKFGADAGQQLFASMGFGLNEDALATAKVQINGDRATVDLGGAGPGAVPMIKTAAGWKVLPEVIDTFNDAQLERIPALKQTAKDIDDGKIANVGQLQQSMGKMRR